MQCYKCEHDMSVHTPRCQDIEDVPRNKKCLCDQSQEINNAQLRKIKDRNTSRVNRSRKSRVL